MKLSIVTAAILSIGAYAQQEKCTACPGGVPQEIANQTTTGNNVCGTIQQDAEKFNVGDATCTLIQSFEAFCCPTKTTSTPPVSSTTSAGSTEASSTEAANSTATDENPCVVCPDGVPQEKADTPTQGGMKCNTIKDDAAQYLASDKTCGAILAFEETCCPTVSTSTSPASSSSTAAADANSTAASTTEAANATATDENPCVVCPDGVPQENADKTTTQGNKCKDIQQAAAQYLESDQTCGAILAYEETCCPTVSSSTADANSTAATTTTEATTTEATTTTTTTTEVASTSTTTEDASSTTTTTATKFDISADITVVPSKAPTLRTKAPTGNGKSPTSSNSYGATYGAPSSGFSVSSKLGFTLASIVVSVVSAMFI